MTEPASLTLPCPAKLNLFLHITGRRNDGYHSLQTVFQILDYGDELSFRARSDGELLLNCTGPQGLGDIAGADNLVLRAAELLRAEAGQRELGADLALAKQLPIGGGVGGGSSDAASALLGLNWLWGLNYDDEHLARIGRSLGADVPVFVRGDSAWAEGVGEELRPLSLPQRWYLVIHPGCHVSTQAVFSHPELTRDTPAITIPAFFAGPTRNDCQTLVRRLYDPVDKALIWLRNFGDARMTGTGACVFCEFASEGEARDVKARIPDPWQGFVARGVNRSAAREQLPERRPKSGIRSGYRKAGG
ncbi:MAG: 4-(cytidine 5'-diphospho)-2-C-methyl-D-erythritol kinase [Pseudomonadota bacterium]